MAPGESVRRARSQELPRLRDIVEAAYGRYLARMDRPPAPMTHDLGPDVQAGRVWVSGNPAVGLICLTPADDGLLIQNVAVHPDAQGRGAGRLLLDFAERHARDVGIGTLRLYTNEVMVENLAIYRHLGYREVDRRQEDGYRRVFMEKTIS